MKSVTVVILLRFTGLTFNVLVLVLVLARKFNELEKTNINAILAA